MPLSKWGVPVEPVPADSVVVLVNGELFAHDRLTQNTRTRWLRFATQKEKQYPALWKVQVWETHLDKAARVVVY